MFLACKLDSNKFHITIYEKNNALARKFLVAGKGGFNLTHSESKERFVEKYTPEKSLLKAFNEFDNTHFIAWLKSIGIATYVGTSHRVFPKQGTKPIEVLNAIENQLKKNNVEVQFGREFKSFGKDGVVELVETNPSINSGSAASSKLMSKTNIVIFALGGSSWSVTGSNGTWAKFFKEKGIDVKPFQASNCAFKVEWSDAILKKLESAALKNVAFSCTGKKQKGELVITQFGIEGSGVYPFSGDIREGLAKNGKLILNVDLKPELSYEKIIEVLNHKTDLSIKDVLTAKIKLSDTAFQLIKLSTTKEEYQSPEFISQLIKNFPITITGLAPIDDAISTVGGIPFSELNQNFELKKMPNTFCIGEMVDWDAPTGGYLLQMCFSMGFYLGDYLNRK